MGIMCVLAQVTVEPVLLTYMMSVFMMSPLLQQLAFKKICHEIFDDEACKNLTKSQDNKVHAETSQWILYQSIAFTIPSIISSLVLGSWSDKIGRRLPLALPLVGGMIQGIGTMINVGFMSLNVDFLLIGISLSGCFGGFATLLLSVFSYIADITDKGNRTLRVAILESMIFLGGTFGELIGGVLIDHSGFMVAFGLTVALNLLTLLYVCFILRESYYPPPLQGKWALVAVHQHLRKVGSALVRERPQGNRLSLMALLGAFSILLLVYVGFGDVVILYSMEKPRSFGPSMIGYFLATRDFIKWIGVIIGMPILTKKFNLSDPVIGIIGVVSNMAASIYLGFASNKVMVFLSTVIGIGAGMSPPSIRAHISKVIDPSENGIIFGAVASFEVLSSLLASVIFNNVYSSTVSWMSSFIFFLAAGLLLIPLSLLMLMYVRGRRNNPYSAMPEPTTAAPGGLAQGLPEEESDATSSVVQA